jgi:3-phytase
VALRQPFGDIATGAAGLALVADGVLMLDAESSVLHRYRLLEGTWQAQPPLALPSLDEPEGVSVRGAGDTLQLLLRDDAGLHSAELPWQAAATPPPKPLPVLKPRVQTAPMPSLGDAADDPAIWVHPQQPGQSRVVTTDKQGGVVVYDLEGRELQDLRVGRINNIDVRGGFRLGGELVDLAVGSNRDHNSLHLFAIDRASGELRDIGEVATPLEQIYGICLYQEPEGAIHAIANDKDGTFLQYRLSGADGAASGELVRRFAVNSQPEGCVADDRRQRLFVGEEGVAVWALDARATAPANLVRVIAAGDGVEADIEGLAIYHGNPHRYLVISSQGNDSYAVLDAEPPFAWRGAFRIGPDAAAGIDGVSETDGLEVTSADLGGPWSSGMLVVQDGRKRMPEGNQNYKYVAWMDIAAALGLE